MKKQQIMGILLFIISLAVSFIFPEMIQIRIILGLLLGYGLIRGSFGFAGSVNRAMRGNSLNLMRALMLMFVLSAAGVAVLLLTEVVTIENMWTNPINIGLLIGGILFGIGMALASCCASGTMTDGVAMPIKLLIVTLGFGLGILLGFPLQTSKTWIQEGISVSFLTVFGDNLILGVSFGMVMTIVLAFAVYKITLKIEENWRAQNKMPSIESENIEIKNTSKEKFLEQAFTLKQTAVYITIVFLLMTFITKNGWGASTPYGIWIGKLVMLFGVDANTLGEFTNKGAEFFTIPFFEIGVGMQNIAIFVGGVIAALTMNKFKPEFTMSFKQGMIFLIGGIIMGFGTRLANGCNVGALYTPIANFSLSGWIFLIVMIIGGIIGNVLYNKIK